MEVIFSFKQTIYGEKEITFDYEVGIGDSIPIVINSESEPAKNDLKKM